MNHPVWLRQIIDTFPTVYLRKRLLQKNYYLKTVNSNVLKPTENAISLVYFIYQKGEVMAVVPHLKLIFGNCYCHIYDCSIQKDAS